MNKNGGRIKLGNYSNGRGYSGWYETRFGKKIFLRSLQEFILAKKLDYNNIPFLMEQTTFVIKNERYKPDFFIYESNNFNKLIKIIELKPGSSDVTKYTNYKSFFDFIGIQFEIDLGVDTRKNYNYCSKEEMDMWRNNSINSNIILTGEKNPMYGIKHSEKTKRAIGKQTKKYMKDPIIKKKMVDSLTQFWKSERGDKLKSHFSKLRKEEAEYRKIKRDIDDPIIDCTCVYCGKTFKKRKSLTVKIACNISCMNKYNWKIGKMKYNGQSKKSYKTRILNNIKLINEELTHENYNDIINKYKNNKIIPQTLGLSLKTIEKYFGSIEQLNREITNG